MYSCNKLIVHRLEVSGGTLILELSIRCVRKRGVETQIRARIIRVIRALKFLSGALSVFSFDCSTGTLQDSSPTR